MIDGNLPQIEAISIVQKLLNGYPARIDKNMRALFYKRGKELKELNFRGHPSAQNEEMKAFWYKAKNNLEGYEDGICEKWEDFYNPELNYHWYGMNFETMLSIIDLKKDSKGTYKLQVIWARFFWQEYKKIVVNGNTFYVYQRNHLENQGTPYCSEEFVNVYDAESQKPLCGGLRELVIRKCLMINQIT